MHGGLFERWGDIERFLVDRRVDRPDQRRHERYRRFYEAYRRLYPALKEEMAELARLGQEEA